MAASVNRLRVLTSIGESVGAASQIVEQPVPDPGPGEVLIRNRYAGINGIYDHGLAIGRIQPPSGQRPCCFGFESVGEVVATGPGVNHVGVGEACATVRFGHAYCDFHCIEAADVVAIPAATPQYLALVPTGASALVALEQVGEVRSGENVLVSAAAGGLGHIAAQIAQRRGNRVVALTGSPEKAERLRALGLDAVLDYRTTDIADWQRRRCPEGFDLIFDSVGGETLRQTRAVAGKPGAVTSFAASVPMQIPPVPVTRPRIYTQLYWKAASIRAFMNPLFADYQAEARSRLFDACRNGELAVWVHEPVFEGLKAIPDAVEFLRSGRNVGKVVVRLGG